MVAASWDSVIFDVGRESLVRVPMMEPERGTKKHVGALFDRCPSAKDLLEAITGRLTVVEARGTVCSVAPARYV